MGRRRTDRGHTHGTPVSRAGGDPGRPHPLCPELPHAACGTGSPPRTAPRPRRRPHPAVRAGKRCPHHQRGRYQHDWLHRPNVGACVGSASQTGLSLSLLVPLVLPLPPRSPPRPSLAPLSAPTPAPVSHHTGWPPSGVQRAPASRRDGVCNTSQCPRSGRRDRWGREVPPSAAPAPLGPRQDPEGTRGRCWGQGRGAEGRRRQAPRGARALEPDLWATNASWDSCRPLAQPPRQSFSVCRLGTLALPGGPSEAGERVWAGWGARRWRWDALVPGPLNGAPGLSWRRSSCKGACSAPVALSICVPGDRPFLGPGKKEPPRRRRLCVCSCRLSSGSLPPFTGIRRPPSWSPDATGSCLNAGSVGCDRARRFDRKKNFTVVLTEAGNPWECPP